MWATVVVPLGLWLLALPVVDLDSIGRYGLSAALPAAWYAALVVAVAGMIRAVFAREFDGLLATAHLVVIIAIVFATVPAVADVPQYAWTYKHAGATDSLASLGAVGPLVDVYHRWPGFFALAAAFSDLAALPDPLAYAAWAEPFFTAIAALLVASIARVMSGSDRVAALAALFFVLTPWVAQSYFAPQALAYLLGLTLMLVVLSRLIDPSRAAGPLRRLTAGQGWRPLWHRRPSRPFGARTAVFLVLALDAVVVVTHQLSPYMIALQLTAAVLLGQLRPRFLALAALLLPVAYLLPHLDYVQEHFGLFADSDAQSVRSRTTTEPWLVTRAGGLVSGGMWVLAVAATAGLARRRAGALPTLALAFAAAPAVTLLAVEYGGEASLRVHHFAAPWLAVLVAWGLVALPSARRRAWLTALALAAVGTLFLVAFFARTALNVIPADEVAASRHFYERAPAGSLLALVNPGFPLRLTARYTAMRPVEGGDTSPSLMARQNASEVRAGSLPAVLTTLGQLGAGSGSGRRYVVFSTSGERYAAVTRLLTPAQTQNLERVLARSGRFRLWHRTANSRIYEQIP